MNAAAGVGEVTDDGGGTPVNCGADIVFAMTGPQGVFHQKLNGVHVGTHPPIIEQPVVALRGQCRVDEARQRPRRLVDAVGPVDVDHHVAIATHGIAATNAVTHADQAGPWISLVFEKPVSGQRISQPRIARPDMMPSKGQHKKLKEFFGGPAWAAPPACFAPCVDILIGSRRPRHLFKQAIIPRPGARGRAKHPQGIATDRVVVQAPGTHRLVLIFGTLVQLELRVEKAFDGRDRGGADGVESVDRSDLSQTGHRPGERFDILRIAAAIAASRWLFMKKPARPGIGNLIQIPSHPSTQVGANGREPFVGRALLFDHAADRPVSSRRDG